METVWELSLPSARVPSAALREDQHPETNYALSEVIESEIRADLSKSSPIIPAILEHSFI
jgi:hypothetical protein